MRFVIACAMLVAATVSYGQCINGSCKFSPAAVTIIPVSSAESAGVGKGPDRKVGDVFTLEGKQWIVRGKCPLGYNQIEVYEGPAVDLVADREPVQGPVRSDKLTVEEERKLTKLLEEYHELADQRVELLERAFLLKMQMDTLKKSIDEVFVPAPVESAPGHLSFGPF